MQWRRHHRCHVFGSCHSGVPMTRSRLTVQRIVMERGPIDTKDIIVRYPGVGCARGCRTKRRVEKVRSNGILEGLIVAVVAPLFGAKLAHAHEDDEGGQCRDVLKDETDEQCPALGKLRQMSASRLARPLDELLPSDMSPVRQTGRLTSSTRRTEAQRQDRRARTCRRRRSARRRWEYRSS